MTFGSEEFKAILLGTLDGSVSSDEAMKVLYDIIMKYTHNRIARGFYYGKGNEKMLVTYNILPEDADDIAVDVFCDVVKSLDSFISNIVDKNYSEKQRQAFLRKIVLAKCARFLNKNGLTDNIIDTEDDEEEITITPVSEYRTPEYIAVCNDVIKNTITIVCDAPFKPEKILGYLYNVVIFSTIDGRNKNSSSKTTIEYMNDKILFVLKENFVPMFNGTYSMELSYEDIDSLSDVLGYDSATIKGKEIFAATAKHITDWTNRMKTYIYKYRRELLDEKGNDDIYVK